MLELNHVSMTFNPGTVNEKKALTDINLHLNQGDFATIVGSNGAGKSTLFNAIAGAFVPDTGTITLDGADITFLPDFRRSKAIGRLFQDPLKGTAPNMTIEENLALAFLRASTHTSPFSRITKADRELFTERLAQLGLGLEIIILKVSNLLFFTFMTVRILLYIYTTFGCKGSYIYAETRKNWQKNDAFCRKKAESIHLRGYPEGLQGNFSGIAEV